MKPENTYCVQPHPGGFSVLEVGPAGDGRWRLLGREELDPGASLCAELAKPMQTPETPIAWLLPDDRVKSYISTFPRLGRKELARVVPGWVAREEGGTAAEWVLDWRILTGGRFTAQDQQQELHLLYAAREVIDTAASRAAALQIRPTLMLPPFVVLDQFFRTHGPGAGDLSAWNLVFLGDRVSFLCISMRETLLLTRTLPLDLSGGSDPTEYLGRLATEVDRSISFARQTEQSPEVQKVLVCGDAKRATALVERMDRELSTPAEVWRLDELFEGLDPRDEPELQLALLAAVLAGTGCDYDLGPHSGRHLLGRRGRRRAVVAAASFGVTLLPVLIVGSWITGRVQDAYLDQARVRLAEVSQEAQIAEDRYEIQRILLARQTRINRFREKNLDYEAVLLRIADLTPDPIVYDDLRIRELPDGRVFIELEGTSSARTAEAAQQAFLELQDALGRCDFLSGVEPNRLEILGENGRDRALNSTVFSMEYQLLRPEPGRKG